MTEDIYDREEHESYEEDDGYFCFSCGWFGKDVYIVKEYGMEWALCPICGAEAT